IIRDTARAAANKNWSAIASVWRWGATFTTASSAGLAVLAVAVSWLVLGNDPLFWLLAAGFACVPFQALANVAGASLRGVGRTLIGQAPEFVLRPGLFVALLAVGA